MRRAANAADRATGLPSAEECESLPSTWITPACASSSIPGRVVSSVSAAAVTCTSAPSAIESVQLLDELRSEMTFRMRDHGTKAASPQFGCRLLQAPVERPRSRLDEDPTCRTPERDGGKLGVVEAVQRGHRHLTSGEDSRGTARGGERRGQLRPPPGQLTDPHVMVVADMGSRADRRDAVSLRLARHCDRIVKVASAVVQSRKNVAVQIDRDVHRNGHGAGSRQAKRHRVAATSIAEDFSDATYALDQVEEMAKVAGT